MSELSRSREAFYATAVLLHAILCVGQEASDHDRNLQVGPADALVHQAFFPTTCSLSLCRMVHEREPEDQRQGAHAKSCRVSHCHGPSDLPLLSQ